MSEQEIKEVPPKEEEVEEASDTNKKEQQQQDDSNKEGETLFDILVQGSKDSSDKEEQDDKGETNDIGQGSKDDSHNVENGNDEGDETNDIEQQRSDFCSGENFSYARIASIICFFISLIFETFALTYLFKNGAKWYFILAYIVFLIFTIIGLMGCILMKKFIGEQMTAVGLLGCSLKALLTVLAIALFAIYWGAVFFTAIWPVLDELTDDDAIKVDAFRAFFSSPTFVYLILYLIFHLAEGFIVLWYLEEVE
ncbi:predicted protein [Chaetoceros tenuissimus]|uniref:Transmembrane protein n=1 Tax=Chaetoceros tenuissimus TaxID=426638 RepID=A0AAD3CKH6_9STRA|nr:predicted protein [Chaetoceros tenuissimus]